MGPDTARERLNNDALDAASGTMMLTRSSIERLNGVVMCDISRL